MRQRKRPRTKSTRVRELLATIDKYIEETGETEPDLHDIARHAYFNGMEPMVPDPIKRLAREMALASRQDYITDENGEPVRRRHAFVIRRGEEQLTLWSKMEDITPERIKLSAARRRNGTLMDVLQLDRDLTYYNKNHNPGDPILFEANFTTDLQERRLPQHYADERPPEE